ncbi:MAG: hypothetical protein FJ395_17425 [Verrucomicrobia bacterium]|nr:hypothetical protein [Verrucomicrobiota bacterium]
MPNAEQHHWNELLADAQQRLPSGQCVVQEAFATDRTRPVLVKLNELQADTFYWFDEVSATALFDAAIEHAAKRGERLTVGHISSAQLTGNYHRLQRVAAKLDQVRILVAGRPGKDLLQSARLQCHTTTGTPLAPYRIALVEGRAPLLFVAREQRARRAGRSLGFFTTDPDTIGEIADDLDALLRGMRRRFRSFERLEQLHQTTQQVAHELESYSRRLQLAVDRARRRPDLLTPARFERIVAQAIRKMEQLQEIPRRALCTMGKRRR